MSNGVIGQTGRSIIPAAPPVGQQGRFWTRARREGLTGWLLVGPVMVYYAVMGLIPMGAVVVLSFVRWTGFSGSPEWVWLHNYQLLWDFPLYRDVFVHTLYIGGSILLASLAISFFIALLLNAKIRGRGIYRTIWYLPAVVSFAITSQMWNAFLDPTNGLFNTILRWAGQPAINWQLSAFWMTFWIIVLSTWKGVGGTMIIFLAGLQGIDPTLYEAGKIDGANRLALLRYVTLPSLRPVTVFAVISGMLGAIQIFEPVQLLTRGGPFDSTTVVVYSIYKNAFLNSSFGLASAMSVVFALLCLAFTVFQLTVVGRRTD